MLVEGQSPPRWDRTENTEIDPDNMWEPFVTNVQKQFDGGRVIFLTQSWSSRIFPGKNKYKPETLQLRPHNSQKLTQNRQQTSVLKAKL